MTYLERMDPSVSTKYLPCEPIAGLRVSDWDVDTCEAHVIVGLTPDSDTLTVALVEGQGFYDRYDWCSQWTVEVDTLPAAMEFAIAMWSEIHVYDYPEG